MMLQMLTIVLITLLMCSCAGPQPAANIPVDKPNILFLFADDWARYAGVYRDPQHPSISDVAQTPTIDRLGREGLVFNQAYMPVPSCTPCRGSIVSGQYLWRNGRAVNLGGGTFTGEPGVWESRQKFPTILMTHGYAVGYSGKVGVDWWKDQQHSFILPGQKYTRHGNQFMNFSQNVYKAMDGGTSIDAAKQAIYDEVRLNFRDLLDDRKPGQPFFYWFGPYNTHRSWVQGSGKMLWGIEPADLKGKLPADWPDAAVVREDVADYLGEVKAFDMMVSVLLDELKRAGELDNTLIVATGDNGIPGFPRAKRNLYDEGVRAPLMINWPGVVAGGRVLEDFVNLMDLAPTFIEAGGGVPPTEMTGRSLLPLLVSDVKTGMADPTRDYVVLGRERHTRHYPMRAIRTKDFLYIRNYHQDDRPVLGDEPPEKLGEWVNTDGSPTKAYITSHLDDPDVWRLFKLAYGKRSDEELYDVNADPYQMKNLADVPEYAAVKMELADRLHEVQVETGDSRAIDEICIFDKHPYLQPGQKDRTE